MEMDFLGPRSAPRHAMPLVARRDAEDDGEPWLLASPARVVAYPDVRAAAAAAHRHHPTAPSYQVRAPPPHPQAFPFAIPASSLQGPQVVHSAAYAPDQRCSAAQLTIFYAGSVHVFDNVTREKAEQITFMAAKAAQAGGSPPVIRRALRQSESAPVPDERKQMPLARACSDPVHPSPHALFVLPPRDVPLARSASLARFLERRKRKQRTANAATPYSRRDISPASVDTFHMVSPGNTTLSGNTELSWFFGDEKAGSRDEEALDTELKM